MILSKAESSKVSQIGADLKPGQTLSENIKNLAAAVQAAEALNPEADFENIEKSDSVQNVLDKDDESSEEMKNLINSIKGGSMQNLDKFGELKKLIDEANDIAMQAEQVMDVAAEEEGAKPEDSALLDNYQILRAYARKIISE